MSTIDFTVVLLFTFLVVACGMSFSKSGGSMKGFFSAGGALPWWMSGLSLFMSFFSAGTFVVWGSIAYNQGWVAVTIQWTMCLAGLIIGFVIAPRWQKTKVLTAAQFIKERLGQKPQKVYTYIFLLITSFSTGAFLYPVAKIVEVSTGLSIELTIITLGILILLYTAVGGLWAVIVTDILQFVVLTAAVLIVVPLSLDRIGGVSNFIDKAPEGFFNFVGGEYSWPFIFAFGLYNLFFIAGNWAYIQRFTSVSTPRDAKKVGWLFGGLYLIAPVIWMIAPMIYRALNPELSGLGDEGAYLLMCKEVLPAGMLGLMIGGMVFATSSSVNTALNITAGVITNDVVKEIKPSLTEASLVKIGKIVTALLGVITIIVALLVPKLGGIVEVVMTLAALTGGALFLPPIWLLFSRYQTGVTILTTTFISLSVNAFFKFLAPTVLDITLSRAQEMLLGVCLPVVILTIFELLLRKRGVEAPLYKAHQQAVELRKQVELQNQTSSEESELQPAPNENQQGLRTIAFGVTSIGATMLALAFVADTGKGVVAIMASIIIAIGLWLLATSKKALAPILAAQAGQSIVER